VNKEVLRPHLCRCKSFQRNPTETLHSLSVDFFVQLRVLNIVAIAMVNAGDENEVFVFDWVGMLITLAEVEHKQVDEFLVYFI
jgi:hypothetical protein